MWGGMGCASVCGDDWAWVWDLLLSGLLVLLPMGGGALPLPAARGFTHLWARLDSQGTWPGALGPLGDWVGPLPGGLGALGLLGPRSGARPMPGRLGPGGVGVLLPLVPGGPLP